jgi:hypothetical protein
MPNFQAAGSLTQTDCVLTITDSSNYAASDESGHLQAAFTEFFVAEVTRPEDSDIYRFNTVAAETAGTDETLDAHPGTTAGLAMPLPAEWIVVNGVYSWKMITIPDYDAAAFMNTNELVYYNGKIYKALQNNDGQDPEEVDSEYWVEVSEATVKTNTGGVFNKYVATGTLTVSCVPATDEYFAATLVETGTTVAEVSISSDCDDVTIVDNSNYGYTADDVEIGSNENGHLRSHFTDYRRIVITVHDAEAASHEMSSLAGEGDETITAPSTANMSFVWDMADDDEDALYSIEIFSVPTWQTEVFYNSMTASRKVIVYHDGQLWEATANNLNQEPAEGSSYWELYTGDLKDTRYYFKTRIYMTCRSIDHCYQTAVHNAICNDTGCDCCDDLSTSMKKAMRIRIGLDNISYSFARGDWDSVQNTIDHLLSICNC